MLQNIKISILSFLALFMFSVPLLVTGGVASAAPPTKADCEKVGKVLRGEVCVDVATIEDCLAQGSNLDLSTGGCTNKDTSGAGNRLTDFIARVLNILSIIVGVIAVVMIIVGGFRYTASGGKEEGVKGAKNSILYALIGLIIVALAQVIVRFVLNKTV